MSSIYSNKHQLITSHLVKLRRNSGFSQEDVARRLKKTQSYVSKVENNELRLDVVQLSDWLLVLGVGLKDFLASVDLITGDAVTDLRRGSVVTPIRGMVDDSDNGCLITLTDGQNQYEVNLEGVDPSEYLILEDQIASLFRSLNAKPSPMKNRDAIAEALKLSVSKLPKANPSDLYHHVVYRLYLREYNKSDPSQSWVRAGGEAVEIFFRDHYEPRLEKYGIKILLAFEVGEKNKILEDMKIADQVPGKSKLDIGLYGTIDGELIPFGGVHSKASLAERVSDDKPCSEVMMKHGYKSYLFTFDAKSFPPPAGDLVNKGELGTSAAPSDKRDYVERHGSFDACFSYNLRTVQSPRSTSSGKRIFSSKFDANDSLLKEVSRDWKNFKKNLKR